MDDKEKKNISNALKNLHKLKGDDIFENKKAVLACIKDEIPDIDRKSVNLLGFAIDCKVFQNIKDANAGDISKHIISVAKTMEDEYGADYNMSLDIVDAVAVFYGKSDGITVSAEQRPNDGSQELFTLWTPGSGVGYSTHNGRTISLLKVCDDLRSQYDMDFSKQDKGRDRIGALFVMLRLKKMYRIARKWDEYQSYLHVYDAYVMDGAEDLASAKKYRKIPQKMAKLSRKFG